MDRRILPCQPPDVLQERGEPAVLGPPGRIEPAGTACHGKRGAEGAQRGARDRRNQPDHHAVFLRQELLHRREDDPDAAGHAVEHGQDSTLHPARHIQRIGTVLEHLQEERTHEPLERVEAHWLRRQGRHRPRLEHVQAPAGDGPFHVLRPAEMLLGPHCQPRQFRQLLFAEGSRRAARAGTLLRAPACQGADDNLMRARGERSRPAGAVQHIVLRRDASGNHGLAQAGAGVDHNFTPFARHRVRAEQDSGGVRRHHVLNDDGDGNLPRVDPLALPVGDGAVRPQRGPTIHHGPDDRLLADDIQECVLLPGKRGTRQVLGRGAGTHGHRSAAQGCVGRSDVRGDARRYLRFRKQRPDPWSGVFGIQQRFQLGAKTGFRQQGGVGRGGDEEARRNRETVAHEFAEIRALPAGRRQVRGAEVGKRTRKFLSHPRLLGDGGWGWGSARRQP